MKVLYLASNPLEENALLLDQEVSAMQSALEAGGERVRFVASPGVALENLPGVLASAAPDVIHISAHGDGRELLFSDAYGERRAISGAQLAAVMSAVRVRPRLLVVNACESLTLAPELSSSADFIIGVTDPVTNQSARNMAAVLYSGLAEGRTVHEAFEAARVVLAVGMAGRAELRLLPAAGLDPCAVRLCERLRLMACLPALDNALDAGRKTPPDLIRGGYVRMEFGVAGAPVGTVQLVVFTDDESFVDDEDELEADLVWVKRDRPVAGAVWLEDEGTASGDCRWFASVVTAEGGVYSTGSSLVDALRRHYLDECWAGPLPRAYRSALNGALAWLLANNGSRRQHNTLEPRRTRSSSRPKAPRAGGA